MQFSNLSLELVPINKKEKPNSGTDIQEEQSWTTYTYEGGSKVMLDKDIVPFFICVGVLYGIHTMAKPPSDTFLRTHLCH